LSGKLTSIERERLLKLAQVSNVKRKAVAMSPIVRAEREGVLPLSFAQQRLWFLCQMDGVSRAYHMPLGLHLQGDLDREVLCRALDRIPARHEALRTTFALIDGEPVQQIAGDHRFHLLEHDLLASSEAEKENELARLMEEEANASFDLQQGPLIRGRLIRLAERQHALLITMHHIVSDGWSMGVLMSELCSLYGAFLRGADDSLPQLPVQYADYAVWQRQWMEGEVLRQQAAYWTSALSGAPRLLELAADHPRPPRQNFAGAFAALTLNESLVTGLKALAKQHGATLYMALLAGWAAMMGRLSGQTDLLIGSPVANRTRIEVENLIGFFVNTLALRFDLSRSPSGNDLIEQTKAQVLAAQQHQDIPFERVVELLQPARTLSHGPLCQVLFAWQNAVEDSFELPGLQLRFLPSSPHRVAKFDLTLLLKEEGNTVVGGVEYATSLFEAATIERYIGYFLAILHGLVGDSTQAVDQLPILSKSERQQLLQNWNDTQVDFPRDQCLHELFEEQARRSPHAVAAAYEGQALTYGELNRRANQLAGYLRGLGVQPDSRVAICAERSLEMMVAVLGVLKAGGAYVPMDPGYPADRLRFMLEDSMPVAVLTLRSLQKIFMESAATLPVLILDNANAVWETMAPANLDPVAIGLDSNHLACVIYTSGSTGRPKGVMVQHIAISNLLSDWLGRFGNLKRDELSQASLWTSFGFDVSIFEMFSAFALAGTLNIVPEPIRGDAAALLEWFSVHEITFGYLPPFFIREMKDLLSAALPLFFKLLLVGVEPIVEEHVYQFRKMAAEPQIVNGYGPAEATIFCTTYADIECRSRRTPIGRPIANTRIYILDPHGQPVPVGVTGEIYIGGAGVARGYLNRAELTAERFLPDPFSSEPQARIYRTGDMGRWLAEGNVEFLGRNDFQVKIRGFRIELGEIEARLSEHEAVLEAVVIAREDTPGNNRLVAYYRSSKPDNPEGSAPSVEQLRAHLSANLPEYMVPAAYVRMEDMPLTPGGKLDRQALPAPEADAYASRRYEPPQGEMETTIAAIWVEVLALDRVGRLDNFFDLGGHSMVALKAVARLRRILNIEVGMPDLFAHPELADLALHLKSVAQAKSSSIPRAWRKAMMAPNGPGIITASRSDGHKIWSPDNGCTWYDLQTGKVIQ